MGGKVEDVCKLCGNTAASKCSSCLTVSYCCREHQKKDWKNHRLQCVPYDIKEDAVLGRHMVAKRSIAKGEIVLKERPLVVGPSHTTSPVCLGCHNNLKPDACIPCTDCGWPLCSERCRQSPNHRPECVWAQEKRKAKVRITQFVSPHPTYACIAPLRLCYISKFDPGKWEKISSLSSHCEDRKKDGKYEIDRFAVANLLRRFYKLEEFTEEEILKICGILQINGHEVPLSDPGYIALYWRCSMLEHNCQPNCTKSFSDDGDVVIRAAVDIGQGDHLSISYTDPLWNTPSRRLHLQQTKYFSCVCPRCTDTSELGTYFSAICCPQKDCSGIVLPDSFLTEGDAWKCKSCKETVPADRVLSVLGEVAGAMGKIKKSNVQSHVQFLEKFKGRVPENHCHLVEVKLTLAQMIGQTSERGLKAVDDDTLQLKERLCRQLLCLAGLIFRAEFRIHGVLHFELHAAIAEKARRAIDSKTIEEDTSAHMQLMESGSHLEKVIFHLKYEPQTLPEGKIYKQALNNKEYLNTLYKSIKLASLTSL